MGTTIELKELEKSQPSYKLLIYSNVPSNIETDVFSMNKALAAELVKLKPSRRTMKLENSFVNLLENMPDNPVIKDIDTMFNPQYKVDVMKILVSAYKQKPFSLIWPGNYSDGKLIYSEEGLSDYKTYAINDYDIICVI